MSCFTWLNHPSILKTHEIDNKNGLIDNYDEDDENLSVNRIYQHFTI
jgi:hypothetical protein